MFLILAVLSVSPVFADAGDAIVNLKVTVVAPLTVVTGEASGIGVRDVILNGSSTSLGSAPSINVCFGWDAVSHPDNTAAYAYWTALQEETGPGPFTFHLSGLQPGTTYYFRVKAIGDGITRYGKEVSFTTSPRGYLWKVYWRNRWHHWRERLLFR